MTSMFEAAIAELASSPQLSTAEAARAEFVRVVAQLTPSIAFEPIVHMQSGAQVGAEALARFPGSVPPAEWFRSAHAVGVGVDLELRVLQEVIHLLPGRTGFVGVNMSPGAMLDPRTVTLLSDAHSADVVIELTEQTSWPKWSVLRDRLDDVRRLGARIALHVSEVSLETTQLTTLAEPDMIKIDRPLTLALADGMINSVTAENFFTRCRHNGVFIVAAGVEQRDQLRRLRNRGIDATQGFVHSTS